MHPRRLDHLVNRVGNGAFVAAAIALTVLALACAWHLGGWQLVALVLL